MVDDTHDDDDDVVAAAAAAAAAVLAANDNFRFIFINASATKVDGRCGVSSDAVGLPT